MTRTLPRGFHPIVLKARGHRLQSICVVKPTRTPDEMLNRFVPINRCLILACILGAVLVAITGIAAADPSSSVAKKHVASHRHGLARTKIEAATPSPALTWPPVSSLPTIPTQPKYPSPFELDYATRLAHSVTAASPHSPSEPDVRPGAPTGPLDQAAQVDSYGLLPSPIHPQAPPLVSIGDWNFSAAAHVPVTRGHDTGAAISAQHEF